MDGYRINPSSHLVAYACWFPVPLRAEMDYGIECLFIPNGDGKTLILKIRYFADASLELVEGFSENVKTFALQIAKGHKWDSWLKIHTKFEPIDRPSEN